MNPHLPHDSLGSTTGQNSSTASGASAASAFSTSGWDPPWLGGQTGSGSNSSASLPRLALLESSTGQAGGTTGYGYGSIPRTRLSPPYRLPQLFQQQQQGQQSLAAPTGTASGGGIHGSAFGPGLGSSVGSTLGTGPGSATTNPGFGLAPTRRRRDLTGSTVGSASVGRSIGPLGSTPPTSTSPRSSPSDPPDLYASLSFPPSDPPAADMSPADPDLIPHQQDGRFPGDLYTPRWVRGHGNRREGWCGHCRPGRWLVLKNSAFWYDKSFSHGISAATGTTFPPPRRARRIEGSSSSMPGSTQSPTGEGWEGLCSMCGMWFSLVTNKKKTTSWFRHAYKCYALTKAKEGLVAQTTTVPTTVGVAGVIPGLGSQMPIPMSMGMSVTGNMSGLGLVSADSVGIQSQSSGRTHGLRQPVHASSQNGLVSATSSMMLSSTGASQFPRLGYGYPHTHTQDGTGATGAAATAAAAGSSGTSHGQGYYGYGYYSYPNYLFPTQTDRDGLTSNGGNGVSTTTAVDNSPAGGTSGSGVYFSGTLPRWYNNVQAHVQTQIQSQAQGGPNPYTSTVVGGSSTTGHLIGSGQTGSVHEDEVVDSELGRDTAISTCEFEIDHRDRPGGSHDDGCHQSQSQQDDYGYSSQLGSTSTSGAATSLYSTHLPVMPADEHGRVVDHHHHHHQTYHQQQHPYQHASRLEVSAYPPTGPQSSNSHLLPVRLRDDHSSIDPVFETRHLSQLCHQSSPPPTAITTSRTGLSKPVDSIGQAESSEPDCSGWQSHDRTGGYTPSGYPTYMSLPPIGSGFDTHGSNTTIPGGSTVNTPTPTTTTITTTSTEPSGQGASGTSGSSQSAGPGIGNLTLPSSISQVDVGVGVGPIGSNLGMTVGGLEMPVVNLQSHSQIEMVGFDSFSSRLAGHVHSHHHDGHDGGPVHAYDYVSQHHGRNGGQYGYSEEEDGAAERNGRVSGSDEGGYGYEYSQTHGHQTEQQDEDDEADEDEDGHDGHADGSRGLDGL